MSKKNKHRNKGRPQGKPAVQPPKPTPAPAATASATAPTTSSAASYAAAAREASKVSHVGDALPVSPASAPMARPVPRPVSQPARASKAAPTVGLMSLSQGDWLTLLVFSATTFLSAVLLFSIQPMFAKMVLPVLGGSPSVWAVAMCFFQGALLAGYCYAHILISRFQPKLAGLIHLGVCAVAFIVLPIAMPASWGEKRR
ncbi:MAG TPA: hypothetical protein PK264_19480 [Hyphomicrobiaceae bacterium]|nr:hypothetical protein [Hyphomicrobiaceae bacterium]